MSLLTASGITKIYDNRKIIENISIHLEKGELVSVLGLSGSGKTTLFQCISGLIKPESGSITLNGEDIMGVPGKVSYMLQKDLLLPHKKIIDNVSLPLRLRHMKKAEARKNAGEYFKDFGLSGTEMQFPSQLSGGMRQRAALLRTYLSADRGVALLDEPFSALDQITKEAIHDWYLDVMDMIELSTLFITHDIDEAIMLSDRIYIMTGDPGTIRDEIIIEEKRPRDRDFGLSEEFLKYKRKIREILSEKD
ncbi:ABC-type nitrate/sulfonate/bicarbonate transport system, ATPase component [Lachnospiraceae bacterium]|nr:ABC-type nitrate/sulfonate/bicarbonate transport system, ATPase component [Lachnospiraceae bacterium]